MSFAKVPPAVASTRVLSFAEERRLQLTAAGGLVVASALVLLTQILSVADHGLACVR